MPESAFEHHRILFANSLAAVAESMRNCAQIAESFAKIVDDSPDFQNLLNDTLKGKGKSHALDDDGPKKRKRNTKPKDPNAPKRPASSYILFQNEVRKELKEKHPTLNNSDLLNLISEQWKNMTEEQKEVYNQAMKNAKAQYSEDKKAYDNRTPEEIEAANAAAAAALTLKKANAKPRGPKAKYNAPPAEAPKEHAVADEASHSSDISEDDDSDDEEEPPQPAKRVQDSESSEEEDEEEPEQPAPKKRRAASVQPKEKGKKGKA